MSRMTRMMTAVSAVLLIFVAASGVVRAEDATAPAAAAPTAAATTPTQPAPDPNAVVAKVGSETVTEAEVALAKDAFQGELANVPQGQQHSVLIDAVVSMKLLALGAGDAGLDKGADFAAELAFLKLQALRNLYVQHEIVNGISDDDLQKAYQTLVVANFKPEPQVRARHILVDTKEAAQKIIDQLKAGASFEELAKQSKDPSGQNGGDLGFFGAGQMVPEFEKAAFALEPGQFTQEPVHTQFGWHVIKVEEKRMSAPPAFADVKSQLRDYLVRQKFDTVLAALRDKYPVQVMDVTAAPAAPGSAAPTDAAPTDTAPADAPAPATQTKP
jgi:peptidyl-prolyl cis-trans isomerase C